MIHDRLRRARVLKGLSLDELAQAVGDITKQALSKFERGDAVPNSTRLLQFAKALGVRPEYFFRADAVTLAPLEFRKLARMPKYRQQQVGEQMRDHLERYIALERCFDSIDLRIPPTDPQVLRVLAVDDAERAARQLRQDWGIGRDAIANLTQLLEERGIKVALIEARDDFDGACAATEDGQHVLIALNTTRPGERVRFTAAHELGHWVMALPDGMSEADKERCCHRFAGAFLYPDEQVLLDFGAHRRSRVHPGELLNAKRRYGVSMQVALRRLKDLDLLSESGYMSAVIQFSKSGWRTAEPEPLLPEQPRRFESLVFWGLAEGLFSASRAAEFLQRPLGALEPALAPAAGA
ncbi:XRE family transcriptional regulator [Mitsuaria sp. GD03876]|uniref:helix-turn-helix domain-containing protein n=1 Tax=Mitsuaria sp. GD03876 TaxID=2975399 RepID=UPI002446E7B3|nr:XRE family transcriptional regulator [Mitsuaria sp. GD03876]MDH0863153.1 XRE family transcriptional regulator [Mitsuaria sp. GD03876]